MVNPIRLSSVERDYLMKPGVLEEPLRRLVETVSTIRECRWHVQLSREEAIQFVAALTERLAVAGFDRDYEVTSEGRLLEDLIDRFNANLV